MLQTRLTTIKIGAWNVRDCNLLPKRNETDRYNLSMLQFGIIALQEAKLVSTTCNTMRYRWILGVDVPGSSRLAFLVSCSSLVKKVCRITGNVLAIVVFHESNLIMFVNLHVPQDDDSSDFAELGTLFCCARSITRLS